MSRHTVPRVTGPRVTPPPLSGGNSGGRGRERLLPSQIELLLRANVAVGANATGFVSRNVDYINANMSCLYFRARCLRRG